jgi:hypothetical protein
VRISAILAAVALLFSWAAADSGTDADAQQLVSQVIENELKAAKDDNTNWMYIAQVQEKGRLETRRVVESKDGDVSRVVAIDGKPLSGEEQRKEEERISKLVNSPDQLEKQRKNSQEDARKARAMLNLIKQAFLFRFDGQDGRFVRLRFEPNPNFNPSTREARVLHAMAGVMLVDPKEKRLAALHGRMVSNVDFGFGLLGRLYKGGTFAMKRAEIAPGHWEITLLDVHLNGKALLFKSINEQQHEVRSNFKEVPDNFDARQAAQLVNRNTEWAELRAARAD